MLATRGIATHKRLCPSQARVEDEEGVETVDDDADVLVEPPKRPIAMADPDAAVDEATPAKRRKVNVHAQYLQRSLHRPSRVLTVSILYRPVPRRSPRGLPELPTTDPHRAAPLRRARL